MCPSNNVLSAQHGACSGQGAAFFGTKGQTIDCWAVIITYAAQIEAVDAPPRAVGALRLAAKRRGPASVIDGLRQSGSLKALFPRAAGRHLDAVFLNTSGGLTGGDHMRIDVAAQSHAHVLLSSQAAERAYQAQPGQVAKVETRLQVAAGGRIDWIPQETILFNGAALDRRLRVDLAPDATALVVEPVVFGRAAMGERLSDLRFTDQWRVYRDGALVFADAVRMIGDMQTLLARKAVGDAAGAMATVLFAGPNAARPLSLPDNAGASLITGDLLLLRFLATDSMALRNDLIPVVEALTAAPMPRVWRL